MICNLCPRRCGVLRTETEGEGWCRMPALPVAARAALHHWEEPPISGKRGSGTVFFSGCSLGCVFCQNEAISHRDFGKALTVPRLREICLELIRQGAHNINFVNPTHYAHIVRQVLEEPLPVPVVWNTGGYDRVETLRALEGRVDVYLPDSGLGCLRIVGGAGIPPCGVAGQIFQVGQIDLDLSLQSPQGVYPVVSSGVPHHRDGLGVLLQ